MFSLLILKSKYHLDIKNKFILENLLNSEKINNRHLQKCSHYQTYMKSKKDWMSNEDFMKNQFEIRNRYIIQLKDSFALEYIVKNDITSEFFFEKFNDFLKEIR